MPLLTARAGCHEKERVYQNSHSLQSIINSLRLFAHALAPVRCLIFQLHDARGLALFQTLGVYRRQSGRLLLRSDSCDLEILDSRNGDDVVVAGVAGWCGTGVDCDEVEDRARGEKGAFVGLRVGSAGGEFDAGEDWVSLCMYCGQLKAVLGNLPCSNGFPQCLHGVHRCGSIGFGRCDLGGLCGVGHVGVGGRA
jgi:hypothetical protein